MISGLPSTVVSRLLITTLLLPLRLNAATDSATAVAPKMIDTISVLRQDLAPSDSSFAAVHDSAQSDTIAGTGGDSPQKVIKVATLPASVRHKTPAAAAPVSFVIIGGNLPKVIEARGTPYLVTSDLYVPSGKTVTIESGTVLLFKNFTGLHVEGRLLAEGTAERPIVLSSEFDDTWNPAAPLHANPYDWNGIYIHESGLGSVFACCKIRYSVYGITTLTKYVRFDRVTFSNNGRSDLSIEGKQQQVAQTPYIYALSIDDAKKDGVPVAILMDPSAKKRSALRYGGLSLLAGGSAMAVWCGILVNGDQQRLNVLKDRAVVDENSNTVRNAGADWQKAKSAKDLDVGLTVVSSILTILGGTGFGLSFTF